ncbi:MAG: hypothetical protein VYA70_11260 [Gemmatimonadota bacterium]|nr:hypothetical protein [Gemmatimonadota bacterium]
MKFRRTDTCSMGPSNSGRHALGGIPTQTARGGPTGFAWESPRGLARRVALLCVLFSPPAGLLASPLAAQDPADDMQLRIGVTAGGIGSLGASVEFLWGSRSIDVNLATFTFNEVSLAVTGKQYFGSADLRPFLGVGLWGSVGSTGQDGDQAGKALLLRLPVGGDWNFTGTHHLGAGLAVNVGLWIDRADPDDDRPINQSPVPLPGAYYRFEP